MATVRELIESLQDYDMDMHVAYDLWLPEDVDDKAKELGYKLTEEQMGEILEQIDRRKDCEVGITWDTLAFYIADYAIEHKLPQVELAEDDGV